MLNCRVFGKLKNSLHVQYPKKISFVKLTLHVTPPDHLMGDLWCDFLFVQTQSRLEILENRLREDSFSWSEDSRSNLI
jgi:hypothetical protein